MAQVPSEDNRQRHRETGGGRAGPGLLLPPVREGGGQEGLLPDLQGQRVRGERILHVDIRGEHVVVQHRVCRSCCCYSRLHFSPSVA